MDEPCARKSWRKKEEKKTLPRTKASNTGAKPLLSKAGHTFRL